MNADLQQGSNKVIIGLAMLVSYDLRASKHSALL